MEGPQGILLILSETLLRAINKRKLFYSVGTTELLNQPEFKSVEKVQPLLSLVEEQNQLGQLLKMILQHLLRSRLVLRMKLKRYIQ